MVDARNSQGLPLVITSFSRAVSPQTFTNVVTNWEPSVQMPEAMEDIPEQTPTLVLEKPTDFPATQSPPNYASFQLFCTNSVKLLFLETFLSRDRRGQLLVESFGGLIHACYSSCKFA